MQLKEKKKLIQHKYVFIFVRQIRGIFLRKITS